MMQTRRGAPIIPKFISGINPKEDWSCLLEREGSQMVAVDDRERAKLFEEMVLPHLDAAYNLARWLCGNDHDAQDVAQEASLRAFRFFGSFRGENVRAWLLTIVRNTFYTWLRKNRP